MHALFLEITINQVKSQIIRKSNNVCAKRVLLIPVVQRGDDFHLNNDFNLECLNYNKS